MLLQTHLKTFLDRRSSVSDEAVPSVFAMFSATAQLDNFFQICISQLFKNTVVLPEQNIDQYKVKLKEFKSRTMTLQSMSHLNWSADVQVGKSPLLLQESQPTLQPTWRHMQEALFHSGKSLLDLRLSSWCMCATLSWAHKDPQERPVRAPQLDRACNIGSKLPWCRTGSLWWGERLGLCCRENNLDRGGRSCRPS